MTATFTATVCESGPKTGANWRVNGTTSTQGRGRIAPENRVARALRQQPRAWPALPRRSDVPQGTHSSSPVHANAARLPSPTPLTRGNA